MAISDRGARAAFISGAIGLASVMAMVSINGGNLFRGLTTKAWAGDLKKPPYALSSAQLTLRTIELIKEQYVDPSRVVPRKLLLAALDAIQRDVPAVLVSVEGESVVHVRVEDKEMTLSAADVKGPWDAYAKLKDVYKFIDLNLKDQPDIDLRDVEYAACNGMLRTLDPHSVLFTPEAFKDFNVTTSGKFGGLGIVIAIRDKMLTVMNTIPGTPAADAGLGKFDRITQINGESTTTMGINEAVQRLRGDPDTPVTLFVHRDGPGGWTGSHEFKLVRKEIHVSSVVSKPLDEGVGYVRLKQFAESTADDMKAALAELRATGHDRGLVLDMRGNPGGLLTQAIKVADAFLKEGTIVIQDGGKEGRIESSAKDDGNEPGFPIAILLNSGSASASEIVAGALKNNDRAVIVGETSFGKGSVQKLMPDIPPEGAALKLTIAQYLTPGDISIQSVGIPPDVELAPMTVDVQELDLTADAPLLRERDLSAHLSNAKAKEGGRPLEVLKYALSREDRAALRERGGDPDETFALDFQIEFARKFLVAVGPEYDKRAAEVAKDKPLIERVRAEELKKVETELGKLGVDWSDVDATDASLKAPFDPSKIKVTVEPSKPNGEVNAGEPLELKVTVQNDGAVPLYRLRAQTKSDSGFFDGKELVFGKVEPGKSRTWTTPLGWCETEGFKAGSSAVLPKDAPRVCRVPKDAYARADAIKVRFEESHEHAPAEAIASTTVHALPRPSFAYSFQVSDDVEGNGDGVLQKGERASMWLTVKNTGSGKSYETEAAIHNLSGDGLLLRDARFDLSNMAPGEERRVRFTFDVQRALTGDEAKLRLEIRDGDLRESASERVVMPIGAAINVTKSSGVFRAETAAIGLVESPSPAAKPFGQLPKGGALAVVGSTAEHVKLDLGGGRYAFALRAAGRVTPGSLPAAPKPAASAAKKDGAPAPESTMAWAELLSHSPPSIEVDALELVTRGDKAHIKATVTDGDRVLDAYVLVGSRKVFYRSNRTGSDPRKESFELDVPLRPGVNYVSVWARESADSLARKVFVIRRDGAAGELLETPKVDDDLEFLTGAGKED
jgi:carboxyl-terminal processing protease